MKVYVCLLVAMLALAMPAQALLGAKLALLGALKSSIGGGGLGSRGYGNGGGYGGGYNYNRPVYTGYSANNGWGQQSYGYGGYNGGYNGVYAGGYNGGNDQVIKVIKVIEEPQVNYVNYARDSSATSAVSSSSSSAGWLPVPAPAPVVQTYAAQPVQSVQVQPALSSVQAPIQVIQPPPRPLYVSRPVYQPQVRGVNVVVDAEAQHVPAQTYGPPAPTYVAGNSGSWSNANSNAGSWKSGGIWESIGC